MDKSVLLIALLIVPFCFYLTQCRLVFIGDDLCRAYCVSLLHIVTQQSLMPLCTHSRVYFMNKLRFILKMIKIQLVKKKQINHILPAQFDKPISISLTLADFM